jgi:hypothetical protein
MGEITFKSPLLVWLGTALLVLVPVYVWKLHQRVVARLGGARREANFEERKEGFDA